MRFSLIVGLLFAQFSSASKADAQTLYHEALRPQFHFTAAKNWLNDPNGLVYFNGVYHQFFQYNPQGRDFVSTSWGHSTSTDLIHWTQTPTVLFPDELGRMWSGSAVVDINNTSGFGNGNVPPIVLIYTAAGGTNKESQGRQFTQCLAFSSDGGATWKKYEKNPVVQHIRGGNRDPKVIWHEPTHQWILALYLDANDFELLASPDLKNWKKLQTLTAPGLQECPDFFEIPIEGEPGKTAWIFTAAIAKYLVGDFDGASFTPRDGFNPIQSEFGRSFYAGQTFSNSPDGRRIQISWMRDGQYPGMPFNQQLSFPAVLTLHRTAQGLRLWRLPIAEIEKLRDAAARRANVALSAAGETLTELNGDLFDIDALIAVGLARRIGIRVAGQSIEFDAAKNQVSCLGASAPLTAIDGKISLRILVDRTSIEVFANHGEVSLSSCFLPDAKAPAQHPEIFAEGGAARLVSCETYALKSAWPENAISPREDEAQR